jgi:HNH endonuclease/AP2 domain
MKNQYEIKGYTTDIFINRRDGSQLVTTISTCQLPRVKELPGTFYVTHNKSTDCYYVKMDWQRNGVRNHIQLHRFLTNAPKGMDVDHENGNTLDNTDTNLRVCTRSQNNQNATTGKANTSGVKGVYWDKTRSKWYGQVMLDRKAHTTGTFDTKEECAEAVIKLREKLHSFATDRAF